MTPESEDISTLEESGTLGAFEIKITQFSSDVYNSVGTFVMTDWNPHMKTCQRMQVVQNCTALYNKSYMSYDIALGENIHERSQQLD